MKRAAVVCYDFPGHSGGYNKSIKSCINQYRKYFNVSVFVITDKARPKDLDGNTFHIKIAKKSFVKSFIYSNIKNVPATYVRYKKGVVELAGILCEDGFDVVIVQGVLLAAIVHHISNIPKCILMSHDCYQTAFKGIWKTKSLIMKLPWCLEEHRLMRFEKQVLKHYDKIFAITDKDYKSYMDGGLYVHGVFHRFPDISLTAYRSSNYGNLNKFVTVGRIDDRKKVGINLFIKNIFPRLKLKYEFLEFHVYGKGSESLLDGDGVYKHGFLENLPDNIIENSVFLNLQTQGAGLQFKLLDALSRRFCVVSNSRFVAGVPRKLLHYVLTYDDMDELYYLLESLISSRGYYKEVSSKLKEIDLSCFFEEERISNNRSILENI